jgi:hypothetical protein
LVGDLTQQAERNASSKLRTTIEVALKLLKTCQKPVGNENDSSYNVTTEESQLGITIFEYSMVFFRWGACYEPSSEASVVPNKIDALLLAIFRERQKCRKMNVIHRKTSNPPRQS